MSDPLLTALANAARDAIMAPKVTRVLPGRSTLDEPGQGRVDRPGAPMGWGERGVFELTVQGSRFIPRVFRWPAGTIVYSLQFEGQEPIEVKRSHFQEPGWYGFKLPGGSIRGGSKLRIYAGVREQVPGIPVPLFIGALEGDAF